MTDRQSWTLPCTNNLKTLWIGQFYFFLSDILLTFKIKADKIEPFNTIRDDLQYGEKICIFQDMDLLDLAVILRCVQLDEKDLRRKENRDARGKSQCVDGLNRLLAFKDFTCPSCQNNCHSEFRYYFSTFRYESLIIN